MPRCGLAARPCKKPVEACVKPESVSLQAVPSIEDASVLLAMSPSVKPAAGLDRACETIEDGLEHSSVITCWAIQARGEVPSSDRHHMQAAWRRDEVNGGCLNFTLRHQLTSLLVYRGLGADRRHRLDGRAMHDYCGLWQATRECRSTAVWQTPTSATV